MMASREGTIADPPPLASLTDPPLSSRSPRRAIAISDLRLDQACGDAVLSARIDARALGWRDRRLWVRMPADLAPAQPHGDPFVAGLLIGAMAARCGLVVEGPVSPSLARNLDAAQAMLVERNSGNAWTRLHRIRVEALASDTPPRNRDAVGLFFSGGVDSMYSLLRAGTETGRGPDALLFVNGFDVPLGAPQRTATVLGHLSAVASMTGHRLVTVETNLREFTDPLASWELSHGGGLAAVGHALGDHFSRWYISASDSHYRGDHLSGTMPVLDQLWSRSDLAFVTIGGRLDRQQKAEILAGAPIAHQHLVVCWQAPPGITNCGRCAKCLRTMLQFLVTGALPRFQTLPDVVTAPMVNARSMPPEPARVVHWEMLLDRLEARADHAALAPPIRQLIARSRQMQRPPRIGDLVTRDGRTVAIEWIRRALKRRMPVSVRRRILPVYRRWRQGR